MGHAVAPVVSDGRGELPLPDVTRALQTILGPQLVALVAGVRDPRAVRAWGRGSRQPSAQAVARLRGAWAVTQVLLEREAPDTIQAWFIGMDPFLDDEPPVLVLRRDPERVVRAARSFLAYG
jgi:rhodanese-related sulfurtransferase